MADVGPGIAGPSIDVRPLDEATLVDASRMRPGFPPAKALIASAVDVSTPEPGVTP
jgi:hypothetical protein